MKSFGVAEPLTSSPFILNGRLVVGDDGDDVSFKEGGEAERHGVDLNKEGKSQNQTTTITSTAIRTDICHI